MLKDKKFDAFALIKKGASQTYDTPSFYGSCCADYNSHS